MQAVCIGGRSGICAFFMRVGEDYLGGSEFRSKNFGFTFYQVAQLMYLWRRAYD